MLSKKQNDATASRITVGAPKVRPRVIRLGIVALLCMGLASTACDPFTVMDEQDPEKLEAYYSGCHTVYEGPLCELPELTEDHEEKLTFWVAGHDSPSVTFSSNQGRSELTPEFIKTDHGLRFEISAPKQAGTFTFEVAGPTPLSWSLAVQPFEPRHPVLVEAAKLRKEKKHAEVKTILEENLEQFSLRDKGEALSLLGRTELNLRNPEAAIEQLTVASQLHLEAGNLSAPIRDTTTYSYTCMYSLGLRFDLARKHTEQFQGVLPQHYESQHFYHWSHARISQRSSDHRSALHHSKRGRLLGQRMGNQKLEDYINHEYSNTLQNLGKFEESAAIFRERVNRISANNLRCEDAINLNGLGWAELLHRRNLKNDVSTLGYSKSESLPDPQTHFERALAISEQPGICRKQQAEDTNSLINLALLALDKENTSAAQEYLSRAIGNGPHRKVYALWIAHLQAKLALAQNQPNKALGHFDHVLELSETTKDPYQYWLALTGKASTLANQGKHEAAQTVWAEAQRFMEQESLHTPIHAGRADFLSERQHAVQSYIESLLSAGQEQLALQAIHRARRQLLQSLQWTRKVENLQGSDRTQWELALAKYQTSRAKLQELKQNLWEVAQEDIVKVNQEIKELNNEVHQNLDHSFAILGLKREAIASDQVVGLLAKDEIELTYFKLKNSWIGFAASNDAVSYKNLGRLPSDASNEKLAKVFLEPFMEEITSARRVSVKPWGILRQIDFHALPLGGVPLITHAPIRYSLGLSYPSAPLSPPATAVIVSDPTGNLAQAREEAKAVEAALQTQPGLTIERLANSEATLERVREALTDNDIFHYAGHGEFSADRVTESSLLLANSTRLNIGDILSLNQVPDHVILSACESARTKKQLPMEALGLAQAFALAGSQTVIATTRPVRDELSRYLTAEIYNSYQTNRDFSQALREAQLKANEVFPDADWSTFRLITPQ